MTIRVKLFGFLRNLAGGAELTLQLDTEDESTIMAVIHLLGEKLGKQFERHVLEPALKSASPQILILKNDVEIGALQGLTTKIEDGDTIVFLPVVHGG